MAAIEEGLSILGASLKVVDSNTPIKKYSIKNLIAAE
jgi:hypothetical protein